ncbi:glycosyltransferase [Pedobacter nanyangensis]|uniref:glycosyltransferase n=1 Tax=Pedobacter nanyangensis TaxID=1562389 RepID=UPI000DE3955B|nr:glycosyltransferase [Pedobacter nanyangensis]
MSRERKLNVIFFPAWYPNKFSKVSGLFVKEHARAINQQVNLAVFHVCAHPYLKSLYSFEEELEDGILVYRIYYRKFSRAWLKPISLLLFAVAAVIGYYKVNTRFKPDLNHVHVLTRMGVVALFIRLFYRTPFVITEHWTRYLPERNSYKGVFRKWMTKLAVKNSLGISTVSQNLKSALLSHNLKHQNFKVIPNVVDTALFRPNAQPTEDFTFLHVSGINDTAKNISGLLRAFKKVLSNLPGKVLRLTIVGDDDLERPILEKYAADLGLAQQVFFVGKKYGKDLVSEYQQASAFVMFSNFENQPCVILEAMSCGLPIVSSSVGGIAEIVDENIGILVKARDEQALQQAMLSMYYNARNYSGESIRKTAEENFAYPSVCSKFLAFYLQAMANS